MARIPDAVYRLSANEIAVICHVDLATARRWKRGATCPPETALWILAGDLGCFSPEWRGWRIRGENLISPEGWQISMGEARSYPLLLRQIATAREEARRLKIELETQEQPKPTEWPAWNLKLPA